MGFRVITITQLNKESALAYICGDTFELECLEASPPEEGVMCRCEFAEVPRNVFIDIAVTRDIGCGVLHLRDCVLTDCLV